MQHQPYLAPTSTPRSSANVWFLVSLLSTLFWVFFWHTAYQLYFSVVFLFSLGILHWLISLSLYFWFSKTPLVSKVVWNTESPPRFTIICELNISSCINVNTNYLHTMSVPDYLSRMTQLVHCYPFGQTVQSFLLPKASGSQFWFIIRFFWGAL